MSTKGTKGREGGCLFFGSSHRGLGIEGIELHTGNFALVFHPLDLCDGFKPLGVRGGLLFGGVGVVGSVGRRVGAIDGAQVRPLDLSEDKCGVYAEYAVQQHSSGGDAVVVFDLSTTLGIVLRIVEGSVDVCQSGYDGKPVVGDFENVLLDVRLYRKGVERYWGYAVLGFGLFGLGFGDGFGACLGNRAEGLVEGVVELGDELGRLGFFVGDGGWRLAKCRRFTKRPPYRVRGRLYVGVVGCGSRVGGWWRVTAWGICRDLYRAGFWMRRCSRGR